MLKKILFGVLGISVLGAGGAAVAYQSVAAANTNNVPPIYDYSQENQEYGNPDAGQGPVAQNQAENEQAMESQDNVGVPWTAEGTISELDEFGLTLALEDGSEVYIELGPPTFWQEQGIALQVKQHVMVQGFSGEQGYHAATVTLDDGQMLVVRNEFGQPMWSGGINNGNGNGAANASGSQDGEHSPEPQAQVDEWVTLEGILVARTNGSITIELADGSQVLFQVGQPSFFTSQGVTFEVGDEISVVGFYENDKFTAGDITQLATGLRVMLRDPNGRPLWAGPGGSGNGGNGNGNGGSQ